MIVFRFHLSSMTWNTKRMKAADSTGYEFSSNYKDDSKVIPKLLTNQERLPDILSHANCC